MVNEMPKEIEKAVEKAGLELEHIYTDCVPSFLHWIDCDCKYSHPDNWDSEVCLKCMIEEY